LKALWRSVYIRSRWAWRKIVRQDDSPESIAKGFALGLFVGMSPYMGFHTVTGVGLAWLLRSNKLAAVAGVMITNPFSAPFIYGFTYLVGARFFHGNSAGMAIDWSAITIADLLHEMPDLFITLTIGGIVLGLPIALAGYWMTHRLVLAYRARRLARAKNPAKE